MAFTKDWTVRFSEVDCARVVYFPRYFDACHAVQEDFFAEALAAPYHELIERSGVGFPSVHAEADFVAPLRLGDVARVDVDVARLGRTSAKLRFRVSRREGGERCATLVNVVACIGLGDFLPREIPAELRQRLSEHCGPESVEQLNGS